MFDLLHPLLADLTSVVTSTVTEPKDTGFPAVVTAAIIAGAASLFALAVTTLVAGRREQRNRRRDTYSAAFAAVAAYKEFPYVVRRRRAGPAAVAAEERVRISEALRKVQQDLGYYAAWMATESAHVAAAYTELVTQTRKIAGRQIHEAWLDAPIRKDTDMNMRDLGLGALHPVESAYLSEVEDHLNWQPTWWRRWWR